MTLCDPSHRAGLGDDVSVPWADVVGAALVVPYLRGVVVRGTLAIMQERLLVLLGLL
jgi:hypothetical protein